ncbi:glycoside hydrolase family 5 protein [Guyanagaster necrorhizus]|uniref:Glycoside hydrolase family 5 protein n=1 Tax=Guyanagaster necrorhizus TaxID=856835 RepID=A0A9P8ATN7_9AGAR|nr:glycoside hydrolase family 5 protein [Guyanagaster necrorhizus MCA 3950]KAG7447201.1 glycoside hydrolase family 5 protein [Guyanagaster necrorhizus MCA 3950]
MSLLKVSGTKIVDEEGKEVILRGAGLGGWMNMENFISGYPGCEFQIREALANTIGQEKSDFFFDKFLEYFFMDADAAFFSSLGLNCIRLPFNYRHFEDDMNPRVLKESGFKHLDRVIDLCAQHNIYTILDLHTTPGGQNTDWHSDHGGHIANFWNHKDFQDRTVWLWERLAEHFKSNKWIAGYNPMNEPTDPKHTRVLSFYDRIHKAIRAIDPDHAIFFDGNTFASDFSHFGDIHKNWDNTAYAIHDYSLFGFPAPPEDYVGSESQLHRLRRSYEKKREWMDQHGLCVWNGEWGPVYARRQYDGDATDAINTMRYKVLKDQLNIYNKDRLSWTIWLYKDIGYQGMVYVSQETAYMTLFKDFLTKKHHLAVDAWGADDSAVRHVYQPLVDHIMKEIPSKYRELYPFPVWKLDARVGRLARNILVAEFLVQEWADHFIGKEKEELDRIAASFRFDQCEKREGLNSILMENARLFQ